MKNQEIKFGNLIKIKDEICRIIEIRESYVYGESATKILVSNIRTAKPIKITNNILQKIKNKKQEEFILGDNIITYLSFPNKKKEIFTAEINKNEVYISFQNITNNLIKIKYLHELQNLYYCITKQELEIDL